MAGDFGAENRRRHVRARPLPELPVEAWIIDGIVAEPVRVLDVSISGLGLLVEGSMKSLKAADQLKLRVRVGADELHELSCEVRHVSTASGVCGVQFSGIPPEVQKTLGQTVSELLARGSRA